MAVFAKNPIAKSDYEFLDTFEAGLVLSGHEVKSIRNGHVSLKGAWGVVQRGEVYLIGMHVNAYPQAGPLPGYDPTHSRKLLLTAKEVYDITQKIQRDGLTLVPLQVYSKRHFVKVSLGLGRRKKKYEKRAAIKERTTKREVQRSLKIKG